MKNKIPKSQIQKTCAQKQEALIENFENRISMMKDDANSRNQSASQRENRTTGKLELLSSIKTELNFVRAEMKYLQSLNPENVNTTVEPGAVVITNKLNFYIAVSSEKVEIEDEVIYGISLKAPIYPAMQGLKKGDHFQFNDTEYEIKDIY